MAKQRHLQKVGYVVAWLYAGILIILGVYCVAAGILGGSIFGMHVHPAIDIVAGLLLIVWGATCFLLSPGDVIRFANLPLLGLPKMITTRNKFRMPTKRTPPVNESNDATGPINRQDDAANCR